MVAQNLVYSDWRENYEPDLLSFLLTYRTFIEPALDVLWHTIYDLGPLMHHLPQELVISEEKGVTLKLQSTLLEDIETVYKLARRPSIEDWQRVLFYTKRIKEFHFLTSIFQPCLIHFPPVSFSMALFPTLWDSAATENWNYLCIFMSESVSSIYLFVMDTEGFVCFLSDAVTNMPHLQSLRLTHPDLKFSPSDLQMITLSLPLLRNLTNIDLNFPKPGIPIHHTIVEGLSRLSNLKTLVFTIFHAPFGAVNMDLQYGFASLEELKLLWDDDGCTITAIGAHISLFD
ncbi:hypothetical protein QCA50_012645 [Cerrena zonata]|uniref:Uncharacterized protein n=1 Tax=Cerrena zonata TaxID=2478898 RepID=A0AAW0FU52_9APHY